MAKQQRRKQTGGSRRQERGQSARPLNGARQVPPNAAGQSAPPNAAGRQAPANGAGQPSGAARSSRPRGADGMSRGQQRRQAMRQMQTRRPWWRGPIPIIATIVGFLVLIGALFAVSLHGNSNAGPQIGQPAGRDIVHDVTAVRPSVITAVGTGGLPDPFRVISGPALSSGGKPELLYIGAEFCPYCAAERWSLVNAVSRFGTISNLSYMRSATNDGNLATFTFVGSHYSSKYISFVPVEYEDRNGKQLQSLTSAQQHIFTTIGNSSFPTVDIAGKYANAAPNSYSGGFDQSVLSGLDWAQIGGALTNPHDPVTQGIVGGANYLTAALCKVTHNQPTSACATSTIQRIERQLPTK